jgi:hypothetical protein
MDSGAVKFLGAGAPGGSDTCPDSKMYSNSSIRDQSRTLRCRNEIAGRERRDGD